MSTAASHEDEQQQQARRDEEEALQAAARDGILLGTPSPDSPSPDVQRFMQETGIHDFLLTLTNDDLRLLHNDLVRIRAGQRLLREFHGERLPIPNWSKAKWRELQKPFRGVTPNQRYVKAKKLRSITTFLNDRQTGRCMREQELVLQYKCFGSVWARL